MPGAPGDSARGSACCWGVRGSPSVGPRGHTAPKHADSRGRMVCTQPAASQGDTASVLDPHLASRRCWGGSAPSCPPPDARAPPRGTAQSAHGDQGLPEVSAVWGRVGRNAGAGGFPSHSRAPTSSPFISCGPRWARHHQPRGLPRRPAAGHGLAAKRDQKRAGDHTAGVAPWVRAEALSQSQRLSGPARKIPASCGPVSPTSPAAAGFSPAGTCRAAAGAVGQQRGECPSVGPWGLPRSGGAPGVLGCARRR